MNQPNYAHLEDKARALNKKLTVCRRVKRLTNDKVWKDIVQPLLDAMISDITGYKKGNSYTQGHLGKPKAEDYSYYVGYKQALMDFNNKVWNYIDSIELLKKQIENLEKAAKEKDIYTNPMTEGPYAGNGL